MKRVLILACALALAFPPTLAFAQPQVTTLNTVRYQVWPVLGTTGANATAGAAATRDTLAHNTARTAIADSAFFFTDSVYVENARTLLLTVSSIQPSTSTAVIGDSLAIPVAWIRAPDQPGQWEQVPNFTGRHLPQSGNSVFPAWTAVLNAVPNQAVMWALCPDNASATPPLIPPFWWKWRTRNVDVRDYLNTATVPVPGKSGTLNFTVQIQRY